MSMTDEGPYVPWRHVERHPAETLRAMLDEDPSRCRALLFAVPVPLVCVLMAAFYDGSLSLLLAVAMSTLVFNFIGAFAHACVVTMVGGWYGGRGRFAEVLAGYAWAQPFVALVVLAVALVAPELSAAELLLHLLSLSIAGFPFLSVALRVSQPRAAFIEGVARALEVGFIAALAGAAWLLKESRGGELGLLVLLAAGLIVLAVMRKQPAP